MSDPISARAKAVDASGIRKVFDLAAKLENPINLSIGLPDFDVPEIAKTVAKDAIDAGFNRYTPTQGIPELRERLKADLDAEMGRDVGDVFIASGVSGALMLAIMALVDPGDEVVFLDPYFVMYRHLVTMAGGVSVPVDSYPDFRFDAAKIEAAITPRTKLLIVNSPSNPTGVTMSPDEVRAAAELARKHDIILLTDEIYDAFRFDDTDGLYSPAMLYDRTLILRGFSKTHGMTGWRVAYVAGPSEIVEQMIKLQQYSYVCAPSPFQKGALAALDADMSGHITAYRRKRDIVVEALSGTFELARPDGAFYAFPQAPAGLTATDFCTAAIEKNVLTIPGNVFSGRDTHFRVSFAAPDEKLREGCRILCEVAG
ncbi:MAG: aminotransferase class I/II-fold pyridoxal phosphate-dependent enzyme [Planctomycetota bacterium]